MDLRAGVRWAEARALLEGTGTQSALSPASLEGWAETQLHKANSRVQKRPVGPDRQTGGREGRRPAQRECVPTFLSTSRSPAAALPEGAGHQCWPLTRPPGNQTKGIPWSLDSPPRI